MIPIHMRLTCQNAQWEPCRNIISITFQTASLTGWGFSLRANCPIAQYLTAFVAGHDGVRSLHVTGIASSPVLASLAVSADGVASLGTTRFHRRV
jgi:hypothetical protein